jgi:hypothetical protein
MRKASRLYILFFVNIKFQLGMKRNLSTSKVKKIIMLLETYNFGN